MRNKLLLVLLILTAISPRGAFAQEPLTEAAPQAAVTAADTVEIRTDYPMADYANPKRYIVNKVEVLGVNFMDTQSLPVSAGIAPGDTVYLPGNYISQAVNSLWSRRYFSDVKVIAEPFGDSVNIELHMMERPRVYQWNFEGVRKGEATELKDNMKLRPGGELSDFLINKHSNYILKYLSDKGFRNAEVDIRIDNDTNFVNVVNVTFLVNKNSKVKIGDIVFEGNEVFSDSRLRRTFKKTSKKNWNIFKGAKLKDDEYENDKENLIDFYNARGYRNAHIVSDSIYDINEKRIGFKLTVDEGNKYYYRNVSWVGNSVYDTEFLQSILGIEKGDTYDRKTLHKRLGIGKEFNIEDMMAISSLYQNKGYLFFQVDPAEIIVGNDSIDLELRIFEGKQATINKVIINGNYRINDEVICRELYTRPGDLYDRSLLMSTMRQLMQMSHFYPEAIAPMPVPVSAELVDITWNLEEQASDRVEISGGWGAGMFVGTVGLELNNVSIKNFFKKGAWRPYPHGQSQTLAIRAQTNGSYYKAFSISFIEPWLGGKKPNSLTVSTHFSDESNAYYLLSSGDKHFRTFGVAFGIGRRLNWPDPYFTLYNEVSYQMYNLKDWDYFIISNGSSNIFAFTTAFGRNSVDQPIYPRRGSEFSISVTLTPPYSLFDKHDYSDPNLSDNDRYRWIEYHKWNLKGQFYQPISRNGNLVLTAKAEMGFLGSYNKNKVSPFEGYDVGGSGMTGYSVYGVDIISMRGYEDGALTPSSNNNDYARVYNKYTVEMRYPFILQPSSQIYGLIFAEAGNAFSGWKKFNPFTLKRSAGAGVRLYLPVVGMLGFDWGYGFDAPANSTKKSKGQIHFMIGQQF